MRMKPIHSYFQVENLRPKISMLGTVLLFLLFAAGSLIAQNESPEALKQQMAKIRQSTNWEDPVAAKKANDEIRELSKKLMMTSKPQGDQPQGLSNEETEQFKQDAVDDKMQLWTQMMNIAREGGDWDLAKPLREKIVQEYKDEEDPTIKSQEYLDEMTLLYIDMSSQSVQLVIDQMEHYQSIKTLVITGGKNGAAVNLENLIAKAAHYPLEQLYIINFKGFVTKVPDGISNFPDLNYLALYNNNISQLPAEIGSIVQLKSLYIEMNPVAALLPEIKTLNKLQTIGIAKTQIGEEEITRIKQQFPNCKIIRQ